MRTPGFEPGLQAWEACVLTTTLCPHEVSSKEHAYGFPSTIDDAPGNESGVCDQLFRFGRDESGGTEQFACPWRVIGPDRNETLHPFPGYKDVRRSDVELVLREDVQDPEEVARTVLKADDDELLCVHLVPFPS